MHRILALLGFLIFPASAFAQIQDNDNAFLNFLKMGTAPQTTIAPMTGVGVEVNDLYNLLTWIGILITIIVTGLFFYIVYKFRESKNPTPKDMHGNTILEILWTAIPILILIIISVPTVQLIFKIGTKPNLVKNESLSYIQLDGTEKTFTKYLDITVVGHQWWWEIEYNGWYEKKGDQVVFTPINRVTSNEPWLPTGVPISLSITSEDVIHSFWPPRLAGKVDALPGRVSDMNFEIEREGFYYGLCAEYCGASHALMRFNIQAVGEDKFREWLDWGKGEPVAVNESAARGKEAFNSCLGCHTMSGTKSFQPRQVRLKDDMVKYLEERATFIKDEAAWSKEKYPDGVHFRRTILDDPDRPVPPTKPVLYRGDYLTVAPDLTDFRFRKRILASIYDNDRDVLKKWIKDPPSIKPEIMGTPVIRMPSYKDIYDDQTIDDIIEYMMTVEYSDSQVISPPQFTLLEN